ncbi:unnamed protein product [Closterium sp. NIES-53]
MGHVFPWLHFIYDLVPLRYGPSIIEPIDFSEPLKWTKSHLFFSLKKKRDKGNQKQDEMHYKMHCTWIHWAMQKARWILSKVTHAFCRFGAQEIHDDDCSNNDIGSLGGWQQGDMRRSYAMGIPFKPVFLQAGFIGDHGDYYIGRARAKLPRHEDKDKDEWWQLLGLMRQHIFPRVGEDLKKMAMENAKLKEENAQIKTEFEDFKSLVAASKDEGSLWTDVQGTSAEVKGSSQIDPSQTTNAPKGPVAVEAFFIVVVVPWRESPTVAAAWKLWVQPSYIMGGKSLRQVCVEFCVDPNKNNSFFTTYAQFADKGKPQMTPGACERKMRRIHLVMQAVETFKVDSSEAEIGTTVALLDDVYLLCNFTELTNGLAVLHETPPNKKQKTSISTEKRTVNDQAQRRVSWLIVKMGLRDKEWGTSLFGDEWGVIKKEELAKEKAEEEKKIVAAAKKAELEKAKAVLSKR